MKKITKKRKKKKVKVITKNVLKIDFGNEGKTGHMETVVDEFIRTEKDLTSSVYWRMFGSLEEAETNQVLFTVLAKHFFAGVWYATKNPKKIKMFRKKVKETQIDIDADELKEGLERMKMDLFKQLENPKSAEKKKDGKDNYFG